jgi:hypothetical protein
MYIKIAEEEDNKKAERWKADADGILFFVSPHLTLASDVNSKAIDGFVLCRSRGIGRCIYPGSQAKPAGYFRVLSCKHISASRRNACVPHTYPFPSR